MVGQEKNLRGYPEMTLAGQKRFLRQTGLETMMQLFEYDQNLSVPLDSDWSDLLQRCERDRIHFESDGVGLSPPVPVDGEDLADLGIPRGPLYGEILDGVEDQVLEGKIRSREEALQWIRTREGRL